MDVKVKNVGEGFVCHCDKCCGGMDEQFHGHKVLATMGQTTYYLLFCSQCPYEEVIRIEQRRGYKTRWRLKPDKYHSSSFVEK